MDCEDGSLADLALHFDCAGVRLGDPTHYVQAQSAAALIPASSGIDAIEAVKDVIQVLGRNSRTSVRNG